MINARAAGALHGSFAAVNPLLDDRDIDFLLYDVLDAQGLLALPDFSEHSRETFDMVVSGARKLARRNVESLLPSVRAGRKILSPGPSCTLTLRTEYPELVTVVRDGDAVLMPSGYHPNVSVPGHRICFLWAMAAHREIEDRQYGVVNVQPGFGAGGSGLPIANGAAGRK